MTRITLYEKIFIAIILLCAAHIGRAESIAGTTISMSAPPNFVVSQNFSGFENRVDNSSITITEMPLDAHSELSAMFSSREAAAPFATRGIYISDHDVLVVDGEKIPFLSGKQNASGVEIVKYLALLKGEKTVLVTFNIMDGAITKKSDAISSVKSIALNAVPTIKEQLEQLNFVYKEVKPFKTSHILQGTTVLLSTFDGVDLTGNLPIAIITTGSIDASALASEILSEKLLRSTKGFSSATIIESKTQRFSGKDGYYMKAVNDGHLIIQYVSYEKGRYIRLVSLGEKSALDKITEKVVEISNSIQLKL